MRRAGAVLALFVGALVATLLLQIHGGAYEAEFSETMDESAHYVTGLLAHDWVRAGMPWPPGRFYSEFTQRYSNVGIGHWPPGFYVLQAGWMLLFGVSRDSMLLLMALVQAAFVTATVLLLGVALRMRYALGAGLLLLTVPLAQVSARSLMGEAPVALLVLAAGAAWRWYFRGGRPVASGVFGGVAAVALLTKGTGIVLAPVPPLTALLRGQATLLRRGTFWLPAGIVLLLCGVWYAQVPGALHEEVAWLGGLMFLPGRIPESLAFLCEQLTIPVMLAALAGVAALVRDAVRGKTLDPLWSIAGVLLVGSILFRAVVAVWEPRHLLMSVPWLLLFAGEALRRLTARGGAWGRVTGGMCLMALAAVCAWNVMRTPEKARLGLREAVGMVLESPELDGVDVLVVSDLRGEGAATAEFAMRERRPGRRVLRASGELAETSFLGDQYRAKFRDAGGVMRWVETRGRLVLIFDAPAQLFPHAGLVREATAAPAWGWRRLVDGRDAWGLPEVWIWERRAR